MLRPQVGDIMPAARSVHSGYRFGGYEVDVEANELRKHGIRIKLQDQPFRILLLLLHNAGAVVSRDELRRQLWPNDTFVDFDNGLNAAIRRVRDALTDSADNPRYIETVPRHGYKFIAPVERISESPPALPQESSVAPSGLIAVRNRSWLPLTALGIVLCLLLLGLIFGFVLFRRSRRRATTLHSGPVRLVVLPFTNLTGDPSQEYFSDGLTEEMITQIGGMDPAHMAVIARTSVMHYKNTAKTVAEIGHELGVDFILEGSVRRAGERVRVSAQLIEVNSQMHLWARDFDRQLSDVLVMESDVAEQIAQQVEINLTPRPTRPARVNPDAYDSYLRGRYYWNRRTEQDLLRAIQLFEDATTHDPRYAPAFAGLADCYIMLGNWSFLRASEAYPEAKANAQKAVALDPNLADAEASLAFARFLYDWDWQTAERGFRRAINLNPNYASAHHYYAVYLISAGQTKDALNQITQAEQLDPFSPIIGAVHAWIYYLAGDYDAAIRQAAGVLDTDKDYAPAHMYIAEAQIQKHEYTDAIEHLQQAIASGNNSTELLAHLGQAYAGAGNRAMAEQVLMQLHNAANNRYVAGFALAEICAALHQNDCALQYLERAAEERFPWLVQLRIEPAFSSLRNDSAFEKIVEQIRAP